MSYTKISEIQRADRTFWSAERGGRTRQHVGGKWVKKFAFSPYTAKSHHRYTFYADVEMEKEIESPPSSGKKRKTFTVPAHVGTFLEFRDGVASGEIEEKLDTVIGGGGGGGVVKVTYWRNSGEKEGEE